MTDLRICGDCESYLSQNASCSCRPSMTCGFVSRRRKLLNRMQKLAADPKRVTKAVHHALTSRHPKRRYLLDTLSRTQKLTFAVTPAAISDAILAAATTSK